MNPIILVGAGILLLGLGLGMGYWLALSQRKREATKVSDIQRELDDYRRSVTNHFGETAQHFQALGQQYRSLYKHMVEGADSLCDPTQSDALLDFPTESAPALSVDSADEEPDEPKVIRDYAPDEELEPQLVEAEIETADVSEVAESASVLDDTLDKPPAEDIVAEQGATPTVTEAERTVH